MKPYIALTIVADYVRIPRYHYEYPLTNFIPAVPVMRATQCGKGIIDNDTFFETMK
jgi:hypothetical protein